MFLHLIVSRLSALIGDLYCRGVKRTFDPEARKHIERPTNTLFAEHESTSVLLH